jgi:hypothetical protein
MSYTHKQITELVKKNVDKDALLAAVEESLFGMGNPGFCIECGEEGDGCEPDAREYPCESCGERAKFGAEELLIYVSS